MNYRKKLMATSIITILFGTVQANDYISIISQEKHVYDIVENSLPVATSWIDKGVEFSCVKESNPYNYPLGEVFTQNENCLQKQERTVTTTEIFNGTPRTTVKIENQNITAIISYLETGLENYNTGTQRTEYSIWIDNGVHYDCGIFSPLASTVNLGESFNQTRSCSQDQDRTETIYDIWADDSETLFSTNTENKTLIENENQSSIGTGLATSCKTILDNGWSNGSGIYTLNLASGNKDVTCDMTTDGGGWTVFQSRYSNTDFFLGWNEYKNGFGSGNNFWLGNDIISEMTAGNKELYIELGHHNGILYNAKYSTFRIENETNKYRLSVSGFSGTLGDSFSGHNGANFSTKDADNDTYGTSCAVQFIGAWWYNACHESNLNALYLDGEHLSWADGINWYKDTGHYYSYKSSRMMFR